MRMYLLAISILVAACADTAVEADTTADEGAVRELIRQTARYNNAADTLGWVGLFEDGAVYMPPGTPEVTTETGLLEVAATGFGSYETSINIEPLEVVILGDWAFARSQVRGTATPRAGGDTIDVDVKQLVLYRRQPDGTWRIARMINNSNTY